jgi:hypothetical protein
MLRALHNVVASIVTLAKMILKRLVNLISILELARVRKAKMQCSIYYCSIY